MIEIEGPDGTIYEFPEGTSEDTMRAAMAQVYGAPNTAPDQAPPASGYGMGPDGMTSAERIAAAKAGTLQVSPEREAQQAMFDAQATPPNEIDYLTEQAMAAYAAGDDATGQRLLTEANRAAIASGSVPDGFVADPRTGGFSDIQNDPSFDMGKANSLGFGTMQGLSYGFGDEAIGGLAALTGGDSQFAMEGAREMDRRAKENPWSYYTGNIGGAIASPITKLFTPASGANLGVNVARGAASGAGAGITAGYGMGEGEGRTASALLGGLTGGVLGGAVPVVAEVGKAAWRGISDALRGSKVGNEVGSALGVSPQTGKVVSDIVGTDDMAAMQRAIDKAGPDAMLADASPSLAGTLDSAVRSPVAGAQEALRRVDDRAAQSYDGIMDALVGGKQGPRMPPLANQSAQAAAARPTINPLYKEAYDTAIDYAAPAGQAIDDLMARIPPKQVAAAVEKATDRMIYDGFPNMQIMASIDDAGNVVFSQKPNVMQLDYMKRAFDDVAEASKDAVTGKMSPDGAFAAKVARDIREATKEAVPKYGEALAASSTDIRSRAAVRAGQEFLQPNRHIEDVLDAVADATPAELRHMREGVMAQIDHITGNVKAVASDQNVDAREALKLFGDLSSKNSQQKLMAIFGDDFHAIKEQLDRAGSSLGLRANIATNSKTFGRGVADRAVNEAVEPGALRSGKPLEAVKSFIGSLTGSSPAAVARMRDEVKSELADLLTRGGGTANTAISEVARLLSSNPINPKSGQSFYNALTRGGFGLIPQTVETANKLLMRP